MDENSNHYSYAKTGEKTTRIQQFAEKLHEFLPEIQKEFDALEELNKEKPNPIFPIKMQALATIYKAAGPLYEWYVQKARKQSDWKS